MAGYDPDTLPVGVLGRPHGVAGEIVLRPFSPRTFRFPRVDRIVVETDGRREERLVTRVRGGAAGPILALEGVSGRDGAAHLTHAIVRLPRSALPPLGPGEFYVEDLPGCEVTTAEGRRLGVVAGTFWNGAHDVMTVRDGKVERLVPAVPSHVLRVDAPGRLVVVDWDLDG